VSPATDTKYKKSSLLNLNNLLDDIASHLTGKTISFPSHFTFTWRDILFAGQLLHHQEQDNYSISLVAELGYIPFSAEDRIRRQSLLSSLTPHFRTGDCSLSRHSQIQMVLQTRFNGPANAKRLIEVITYTLLDQQNTLETTMDKIAG